MNNIQIGDRVRMSDVGRGIYPDTETNPHGKDGVVEKIETVLRGQTEDPYIWVIWEDVFRNVYRPQDLELTGIIIQENE